MKTAFRLNLQMNNIAPRLIKIKLALNNLSFRFIKANYLEYLL